MSRAAPRTVILGLAIAAAGLAAYGPALRAAFQFDDFPAVVENPALAGPLRLRHLLEPSAAGADYVRPVLFLSYRLGEAAARRMAERRGAPPDLALRSAVQHAGNLVLHVANALLVLALGRTLEWRAGRRSAAPAVAALLFAVHPALSQGVYYVAARSSVLVTTFGLAAAVLALRGNRLSGAASCVTTALALLTKEPAIVLPLIILAAGRLTDPGRRWRPAAALPHAALAALAAALWAARSAAHFQPPVLDYALAEVRAWARYAALLLVPHGLRVDYGWVPAPAAAYWPPGAELARLLGAALLLGGLGAAAVAAARRRPLAAAGLAWFALALLPTSSFFPIRDPIFEHHLVFAAPGFLLAAADFGVAAAGGRRRRWRRPAASLLLGTLLVLFAAQSRHRALAWTSERALWEDCLAKAPGNARAAYNLAAALTAELAGAPAETRAALAARAEALYRRALALHPEHAPAYELRAYATTNLGYLYLDEARRDPGRARAALDRAVAVLDTAVTWRVRAGAALVPFPEAWSNLGLALAERAAVRGASGDPGQAGDAARARTALTTALRLRPDPAVARRLAELDRLPGGGLR